MAHRIWAWRCDIGLAEVLADKQGPAAATATDGRLPGIIRRMTRPDAGLPGNIGAPATRALTGAGYAELRQLANVPAAELRKLHGVGPKALRLLQEALEEQGMSLS